MLEFQSKNEIQLWKKAQSILSILCTVMHRQCIKHSEDAESNKQLHHTYLLACLTLLLHDDLNLLHDDLNLLQLAVYFNLDSLSFFCSNLPRGFHLCLRCACLLIVTSGEKVMIWKSRNLASLCIARTDIEWKEDFYWTIFINNLDALWFALVSFIESCKTVKST